MTDLLVITEWYNANKNNNEIPNVDSRLMAQISIGILVFCKIISSIAVIVLTNGSCIRAILQFLDLLLFEEMLIAHKKVVYKSSYILTLLANVLHKYKL